MDFVVLAISWRPGRVMADRSNAVFTGEALPPVQRTNTATEKAAAAAAAAGRGGVVVVPVPACDDMVGICGSPSAGSAPPATATTSAAHFLCAPAATAPLAVAPSPLPPMPPRSVCMSPSSLNLLSVCYCYCCPIIRHLYSRFCCWLTKR